MPYSHVYVLSDSPGNSPGVATPCIEGWPRGLADRIHKKPIFVFSDLLQMFFKWIEGIHDHSILRQCIPSWDDPLWEIVVPCVALTKCFLQFECMSSSLWIAVSRSLTLRLIYCSLKYMKTGKKTESVAVQSFQQYCWRLCLGTLGTNGFNFRKLKFVSWIFVTKLYAACNSYCNYCCSSFG